MLRWICVFVLACAARGEFLRIEMGYEGKECGSCSTFIENKLKKNPGVQSIEVDAAKKNITVTLKAGNTVKFADVRDFVQQSGYAPQDSAVTVIGVATMDRGIATLNVGNGEMVRMKDPDTMLREVITRKIEVVGTMTKVLSNGKKIDLLVISRVTRVQ